MFSRWSSLFSLVNLRPVLFAEVTNWRFSHQWRGRGQPITDNLRPEILAYTNPRAKQYRSKAKLHKKECKLRQCSRTSSEATPSGAPSHYAKLLENATLQVGLVLSGAGCHVGLYSSASFTTRRHESCACAAAGRFGTRCTHPILTTAAASPSQALVWASATPGSECFSLPPAALLTHCRLFSQAPACPSTPDAAPPLPWPR